MCFYQEAVVGLCSACLGAFDVDSRCVCAAPQPSTLNLASLAIPAKCFSLLIRELAQDAR